MTVGEFFVIILALIILDTALLAVLTVLTIMLTASILREKRK